MPKGKPMRRYRKKYYRRKSKLATRTYVKKLIAKESETKYYDKLATANVDASGSLIRLTEVPIGQTDSSRIGDKLTMRAFQFKLQFGIADTYNMLRVILFQWYPNTTLSPPAGNDILIGTLGLLTSFMSMYTHDYLNQFHILYDKMMYVDSARNHQQTIVKKINLKYAKKVINFTAGSIEGSNHLYLLLVSDSTAASHPGFNLESRVWYDDS